MSTVPPKPKPGGLAFLIPVAIWVVFSVVATVLLVNAITRQDSIIDDFHRIPDGEEATVALDDGGHTIWLERPGVDDEQIFGSELEVAIVAPDGSTVPTDLYDTDASYSQGGRDGVAALTFDAPVEGDYTITPTVNDFRGGTIAIGTENPLSVLGIGFALFFGIGTVGFLIALAVLIVLLVKRSRSKKQIRAANAAAFGYPPTGYAAPGSYPPAGYGAPTGAHPQPGAYPPPGPGTPPPAPGPPPGPGAPPPGPSTPPPEPGPPPGPGTPPPEPGTPPPPPPSPGPFGNPPPPPPPPPPD